jgi:hypothetical protein
MVKLTCAPTSIPLGCSGSALWPLNSVGGWSGNVSHAGPPDGASLGKLGSGGLHPIISNKGDPKVCAVWPSTRWRLFDKVGLIQAPGL